mgnify:CR=1 FL=1
MENDDSKVLNLYPIDYPIETLVGRFNSAALKLMLTPDFQRKYKWDDEGWERVTALGLWNELLIPSTRNCCAIFSPPTTFSPLLTATSHFIW